MQSPKNPGRNLLNILNEHSDPETDEDKLFAALGYALMVVRRWEKDGEINIPEIDAKVSKVLDHSRPIFELQAGQTINQRKFSRYDFDDLVFEDWHEIFCSSPDCAQMIKERIAANLVAEAPIPHGLRVLAFGILSGAQAPVKRPARKKTLLARDTLIAGISKRVCEEHGYDLGASKVTYSMSKIVPVRGCTIAVAALNARRIFVAPKRADAIARRADLPIETAEKAGVLDAVDLPLAFKYFGHSLFDDDQIKTELKEDINRALKYLDREPKFKL